ncbi:MAG: hypothetical protein JNJ54_16445 [Myxococcaceae bacterium]|nr:hypothetical protein [Myxococcaceae bacterium]
MLLLVAGLFLVSCLVLSALVFGALKLADTSVAPIPSSTTVQPGFDGPLEGTWRQLRGGFTGVEASEPDDSALTSKWPPGSVVELSFSPGQRYRFTFVEATGSGVTSTKTLVREAGAWAQQGEVLDLTVEKALEVRRWGSGKHSAQQLPSGATRRFRLETRITESDGPAGAAPVVREGLRLTGPCPWAPDTGCQWDLEQE